ncbi:MULTISPECIES: BTAD domain-containing putative transcriptional regulator [Streptomyces]|uniref:AfsR/SARP family transcriptional regulator n=1 Tax=Streptomyces TaxID=1883 RepID=UPI003696D519
MRLGVLGPLLVTDSEDRTLSLRSLKTRVLLANLLIHYGRVTPVDLLIEELWADAAPKNMRSALQVYVSNLRKLLRAAGLSPEVATVSTHPSGYMIEVDKREFDLARFEEGIEAARQAKDRGELDTASLLLKEGIGLWRGSALADIDTAPTLRAEARRLNELKITAQELHVGIDLELGRDQEVIGDLYALIAKYPLREKLREYLMIALHSQGRPAEALQTFTAIRSELNEQLGLEPGPKLQKLQRMVLSRNLRPLESGLQLLRES